MKKIAIVLAVLLAAVPAMAVVTITATQVGPDTVDISFTTSGESGKLPRAFALDITVDSGQTIDTISGYFTGECTSDSNGFGIFPANFNRYIDADDPCWGEPNYDPVAEADDLPGDTEGGLGTSGITIEMGSLYKGPNSPKDYGSLAVVSVSGSCYLSLAANIGRGKVIMEDGNEPASLSLNGTAVVVCTVPNVLDMNGTDANDAIGAAGFVSSVIAECNDTEAAGEVLAQSPSAGATPGCGATVTITVSTGPCAVATCWTVTECPGQVDGDADCDGDVDLDDLLSWKKAKFTNYGVDPCGVNVGEYFCCADSDQDSDVDLDDLITWKTTWAAYSGSTYTTGTSNTTCP